MLNLSNVQYFDDPWPHVVIPELFSDLSVVKAMTNTQTLPNYLRAVDEFEPTRSELSADQIDDMQDFPDEISAGLRALDNSQDLLAILEQHLLPKLKEAYPDKPDSYWSDFDKYVFKYGGYSPITKKEDVGIELKGTHIDGGAKIYTGMVYFREAMDHDEKANFYLEKYDASGKKVDEKYFRYGNNVAIFWANLPECWHRAEARGTTGTATRRFINFVANGKQPLHDYRALNSKGQKAYGWKEVHKL